MGYGEKSREELIADLEALRRELTELEDVRSRLRETEQALTESEILLEQLSGHVRQFFFLRSREKALYVGPAYETIFRRPSEEIYRDGNAFLNYVHEADRDRVHKAMLRSTFQEGESFDEEYRVVLPDGSSRWVWSRSFPVKNSEGQVYRQVGLAEDITDRKQKDEQTQQHLESLRQSEVIADLGYFERNWQTGEGHWSDGFCRILGLEPGSGTSHQEFMQFIHDDDRERVASHIKKALEAGDRMNIEFRIVQENGQTVHVHGIANNYYDDDGRPLLTRGTFQDFSERKRQEDLLRAREEMIRAIVETSQDWIWSIDLDGVYTYCNPAIESILGYSAHELIGASSFDLMHDDDGRSIEADMPQWLDTKSGWTNKVIRRRHKDGRWRILESSAVPVFDPDGDLVGFSGIDREITDRKKADEALRISERTYREIFNAANEAIFIHDTETGEIVDVNQSMCNIYGYSPEEVRNLDIGALSSGEPPYTQQEALEWIRHAAEGESQMFEWTAKDKSGRLFWVEVNLKRAVIAGKDRLLAIVRDITERKKTEEALRESEEKFRTVFEQAGDSLMMIDPETHAIVDFNEKAHVNLGYSREEFSKLFLEDLETVGCFEEISNHVLKVLQNDGVVLEARLKGKDGEIHDFVVSVRPVFLGGKQLLLAVASDITERKKAEMKIRKNEELLGQIMAASPVGISLAEDRKIQWLNETFARMFGYEDAPEEEYIAKSTEILYSTKEEYERVGQTMYEGFKLGKKGATDATFKRRDGSRFDGHIKMSAPDPANPMKGTVITVSDITDRKRMERELLESRNRYRQLTEVTREGIVFHYQGVVLDANPQYWEMFGYEPNELIGKQAIPLTVAPESIEAARNRVLSGFEGKYEITGLRKDGTRFPLEIDGRTGQYEGKSVRVATFRDLSGYRHLEKQLREAQKMQSLGTMAGGISHDFNNLLQIITGHAELLEVELAERGLRFPELDAIRESAERGAGLVTQILAYSRRLEPKFERIDLNDHIRASERLLSRTIPRMIKIELELEEDLRPVEADRSQIEQVLINLSVNARDAMPNGGKLTFETLNVDLDAQYEGMLPELKPGGYVLLRVSDSGHGMCQDVIQQIFEPFFTTKERADGTGLGLATVYGVVKMHGGHIECESEPGKGTTFSMYFPAIESPEDEAETERNETAVAGGTETILVVDDEPLIAGLAQKILENVGYSVITAGSGTEALEIYSQRKSDIALIILDLIMPEMGGRECLQELLKIDSQVKVLIASGFAVDEPTKRFLDAESRGSVKKPFNIRGLLEAVRNVIERV